MQHWEALISIAAQAEGMRGSDLHSCSWTDRVWTSESKGQAEWQSWRWSTCNSTAWCLTFLICWCCLSLDDWKIQNWAFGQDHLKDILKYTSWVGDSQTPAQWHSQRTERDGGTLNERDETFHLSSCTRGETSWRPSKKSPSKHWYPDGEFSFGIGSTNIHRPWGFPDWFKDGDHVLWHCGLTES